MQEERVASDIHVFTSELYAQVTAGLVVTREGCILIDTLPFPEETSEIIAMASDICPGGVQLLVLTHYHADHTYGAYQLPNATVVGHTLTRDLLIEKGGPSLAEAKEQEPALAEVELVLPTVVFDDGALMLHLGAKTLQLFHSPGHTPDTIATYVVEDKVLFASDTMMPVPTIFDGDLDTLVQSLNRMRELPIECVVQGHGEVILRGEVTDRIDQAIAYLYRIRDLVYAAVENDLSRDSLSEHDIESCGLSRIPLNGLVQQLHEANLYALYHRMAQRQAAAAD
jgi:glyoxylase-like metal-dependent hydrolase (beta-lactamase superfamily II)